MFAFLRSEAALIASASTAAVFLLAGDRLLSGLDDPWRLGGLFAWIFAVMIWGAFGVARHAEGLATVLKEPYGTLILTLSAITIEVALIASVMLTGPASPTLARDTMMAVLMIVLNGIVGLSLLLGGLRNVEQEHNFQGAQAFLAVIATLATMSLILPRFTTSTDDPSLTSVQAVLFSAITIALYATFLGIQTVRHRSFFVQPDRNPAIGAAQEPRLLVAPEHGGDDGADAPETQTASHGHARRRRPAGYHAVLLVLNLLPIVLLSKSLAVLMDQGTVSLSLPVALGGVLVAIVLLSPEGLAAVRAARSNRIQRSINLCLGAALSSIGLTVPAVLAIGLVTGKHVILGVGSTDMLLLLLTLFLCAVTFSGARTNLLLGAVHLVVFLVYLVLIFDP